MDECVQIKFCLIFIRFSSPMFPKKFGSSNTTPVYQGKALNTGDLTRNTSWGVAGCWPDDIKKPRKLGSNSNWESHYTHFHQIWVDEKEQDSPGKWLIIWLVSDSLCEWVMSYPCTQNWQIYHIGLRLMSIAQNYIMNKYADHHSHKIAY